MMMEVCAVVAWISRTKPPTDCPPVIASSNCQIMLPRKYSTLAAAMTSIASWPRIEPRATSTPSGSPVSKSTTAQPKQPSTSATVRSQSPCKFIRLSLAPDSAPLP